MELPSRVRLGTPKLRWPVDSQRESGDSSELIRANRLAEKKPVFITSKPFAGLRRFAICSPPPPPKRLKRLARIKRFARISANRFARIGPSEPQSPIIGGRKTAQEKKTNSWERRFPGTFRTNVPLILPIFSVFSVK